MFPGWDRKKGTENGKCGTAFRTARAIWKKKNLKFEETNPTFGPTKWEQIRDARQAAIQRSFEELNRRIENTNRLEAVVSKMGRPSSSSFSSSVFASDGPTLQEIALALAEDAQKDFEKELPEVWGGIEEEQKQRIRKVSKTVASNFVEQQFKE
jgi:hypothetical protein